MELSSTASNPDVTVSLLQAIQGELILFRSELIEKDKIELLEKKLEYVWNGFKEDLRNVRNEATDLTERILHAEIYMSRDTIIIHNPPVSDERNLMNTVNDFFNKILHAPVQPEDLKAVHFLGNAGDSAMRGNFLWFGLKQFNWRSETILKDYKNPSNIKPYYLSGRLPPMCRETPSLSCCEGYRCESSH